MLPFATKRSFARTVLSTDGSSSSSSSSLWHAVEGEVAVSILVAFVLLVGDLFVGLGRVFLQFTGVVWFIVGDFVEIRLYDHPHHGSLCCLEFLLLLRPRTRSVQERWCHRGVEEFESVL